MPEGDGTGRGLAEFTYGVLQHYKSADSLQAVIMDNTGSNMGYKIGLAAELEKKLGRKVHKVGCLLHFNELPLKTIIRDLDGPSAAGNKLTGPIGSVLPEDWHKKEPVKFTPVPTSVKVPADDILKDLSNDQRLLLEFMLGVASGTLPPKFSKRRPGPVSLSRWLTTALRILVYYTRSENPSETLVVLVKYIQTVYGPFWFELKLHKNFLNGPRILTDMYHAAASVRHREVLDIVKKKIQGSGFAFLPENFMASLLFSKTVEHRQRAVNRIRAIRSSPEPGAPKSYPVPKINFAADDWSLMIDIASAKYEPPCVSHLTDEELETILRDPGVIPEPEIPIHTQSVERAVRLTSEACGQSYSTEKRHNYIVAKSVARGQMSRFKSKQDFV